MEPERHPTRWGVLFPAGTRVVALPSWRQPRLLVAAETVSRAWEGSRFYPAYRWTGRLYQLLLRLRTLARVGAARASGGAADDTLHRFLADVLPHARLAAVQVGMPGLAQKLTAKLVDATGRAVGFLKCAEQELARERLRGEYEILRRLPAGTGPVPLKFGALDGLDAMLLEPVEGRHPPSTPAPSPALYRFTSALITTTTLPLERHPYGLALGDASDPVARHVEALASRDWAIAFRHGDLAPWNLLRTRADALVAIDWEYGSADGLPCLDVAQYVLQVALLIARWRPGPARELAAAALARCPGLDLAPRERAALVALAAYDTYRAASREGLGADDPRQRWRRAVWEWRP